MSISHLWRFHGRFEVSERLVKELFFLVVAGYLLFSCLTIRPGYLLNDEAIYQLAIKNFAETGGFEVWTGYQEFSSPELIPLFIQVHKQRPVAQYPYLFPLLCIPFYWLWGFYGQFLLNVFAFPGTVALCYIIAKRLFFDYRLAVNACVILVLATFSFEQSQAALTHGISTFFITAASFWFLRSFNQKFSLSTNPTSGSALIAGLLIGFGMGIRLDVFFLLPSFALFYLFMRPWRPRAALSVCLGAVPGIAILSATNAIKFGTFSFLSYGSRGIPSGRYVQFASLSGALIIALWIITRRPVISRFRPYFFVFILLLLIGVGLSLFIPEIRSVSREQWNNIIQLVVDFRVRRNLDGFTELLTLPLYGRKIVTMGGLKKSLLQSCPYLVVLMLPILKILKRQRDAFSLLLLCLVPAAFTGFYAYHGWYGGDGLNLRYLTPIFPFTSILTAYAWRELSAQLHWRWPRVALITGILTVTIYLVVFLPILQTIDQQEFPCLTLPLLLAVSIYLLLMLREIITAPQGRQWVSCGGILLLFIAIIWAGLMEFCYDYPLAYLPRRHTAKIARYTRNLVKDNAIIFASDASFLLLGLVERDRIRVANPQKDDFKSFQALLAFHLKQGHSVYAVFDPWRWQWLRKHGYLPPSKYKVLPYDSSGIVFQISLRSKEDNS